MLFERYITGGAWRRIEPRLIKPGHVIREIDVHGNVLSDAHGFAHFAVMDLHRISHTTIELTLVPADLAYISKLRTTP